MKQKLITILMLASCWVLPASAVTIYSEIANGDIDGVTGTAMGDLMLGENTIDGFWTETPGPDTDRFNVTLAAGLQIDSITLSTRLENGEQFNASLGTNGNLFDDGFYTISGANSLTATFQDTFGPDTGTLDTQLAGSVWDFWLTGGLMYNNTNWLVTITTSAIDIGGNDGNPVPLPPTLSLVLIGLAGLLGTRRHSKTIA